MRRPSPIDVPARGAGLRRGLARRARVVGRRRPPRRSRGAALLVAMESGPNVLRMAVNSILSNDVLQGAESANEVILNDRDNLAAAYLAADDTLEVDDPLGDDSLFDSRVTLRYVGEGNAVGASLDASQMSSSFDALRYVAEGEARLDAVRASRRVDQGAYRNAPSN